MNNKGFRNMMIAGAAVLLLGMIAVYALAGMAASFVVLAMGMALLFLFYFYTSKRYDDLKDLNSYLSAVLAGDYDLQPGENAEGELSILQNNLYKATILLQSQNEQLAKDKKYLADIMADISHQLKTPLTSMGMMNELLEGELMRAKNTGKTSDSAAKFLEIQSQQVDKMSWLVQNLLKLSKLDAGIVELKKEKLSLEEVMKESLHPFLIQMDIEEKILEKDTLQGYFIGDRNWTIEVFRNVIKNCLEHMQQGGRLKITSKDENLYTLLRIEDDGCGIDPQDLPHIFERFYRGKDASPGSIGIGLALAQAILEKERGAIQVESQLGKGSTFEIKFYKSVI